MSAANHGHMKKRSLLVLVGLLAAFASVQPAPALFEATLEITDGPATGAYPSAEPYWTIPVWSYPGGVAGPTVYGGYACTSAGIPPASSVARAPGEYAVLVVQRGPSEDPNAIGAGCLFGVKAANAIEAGYSAVIFTEHHAGAATGADVFDCQPPGQQRAFNIAGVCIGHRALHLLFDRAPDYTRPYPMGDPGNLEPNIGELGRSVRLISQGEPVLTAGQRIGGGGWASFAVSSPGGKVRFPLRLDGETSPSELGAWLYDENGAFVAGTAFGVYRSEVSTYNTVGQGDQTLTLSQKVSGDRQGPIGMAAEVNTPGPAKFKLLVWGIGRGVASWQWAMRGGPGVELHGTDSGTRAWYYSGRDFESPANIEANAPGVARATVLGTKSIDVQDTFIGGLSLWSPLSNASLYTRTVSTPASPAPRICQDNRLLPQTDPFSACTFTEYEGATRAGAGSYTFEITGAGAGAVGEGDVKLWGIDSRMPPFRS